MREDITYQNKAVEWLVSQSKDYLKRYDTKGNTIYYLILQAITGSGKTVILSKYINYMLPDSNVGIFDELAFIWLSVGSGNLHIQSAKKLKKYLPDSNKIMYADEAILNNRLNAGEILVLNWESLNTKKIDKKTGLSYFDNIFMRKGDKRNLQTLWENTRNIGLKIVLIIDESHNTAGSDTSREIIELISPAFVIELSATPDFNNLNYKEDYDHYTIKVKDVIDAQVIKKNIRLNDTTDTVNSEGVIKHLLSQAVKKREELKKAYLDEGVDYINPLCLIQLPDGEEGKLLKNDVIKILHEKNIKFSNNKLAIWLSEKENKINLDNIADKNSVVEYLIFKQAIATGWDCPRASILVKLRDIKSETFDLQTIGRILRMPELEHYTNEVLNDSYIYTNAEYKLNTGGYTNILPQRQILKDKFKEDVLNMKFISEVVLRDKLTILEEDIIKIFTIIMDNTKDSLKSHGVDEVVIASTVISPNAFHKKSQTEIDYHKDTEKKIKFSLRDIDRLYKLLVYEIKSDVLSYILVDNLIINYFKKLYSNLSLSEIKKVVLFNKKIITEAFSTLKEEINRRRIYSVIQKEITFEVERHASNRSMINLSKCAYDKHFISKYKTEDTFERYLEGNSKVSFWIKNGDSGQTSLSLSYNNGEIRKEFFPDYIIKFKDGRIGLFEVKDVNDREKNTITPKKINALNRYCNKYGLIGGLVEINGDNVYESTLHDIFIGY